MIGNDQPKLTGERVATECQIQVRQGASFGQGDALEQNPVPGCQMILIQALPAFVRTVNPSIAFDANAKMPVQLQSASSASGGYRQNRDLPETALIHRLG